MLFNIPGCKYHGIKAKTLIQVSLFIFWSYIHVSSVQQKECNWSSCSNNFNGDGVWTPDHHTPDHYHKDKSTQLHDAFVWSSIKTSLHYICRHDIVTVQKVRRKNLQDWCRRTQVAFTQPLTSNPLNTFGMNWAPERGLICFKCRGF